MLEKGQVHKLEREGIRDPLEEVQGANAADVEVTSVRVDVMVQSAV